MKKILGVALLGALAAAPAGAQVYQWEAACSGGPFSQCASAQLSISGTSVELRFWNLAGIDALTTNDLGGWRQIGFEGFNFGTVTNFEASFGGNPYPTGTWSYDSSLNPADGSGFLINGNPRAIFDAATVSDVNKVRTTWTPGDWNSGYVLFTWTSDPGIVVADESLLFLTGHIISNEYGSITYRCEFEGTCSDIPGGPQEVVPEPATMTLLATGLAGLAAARRRRKNNA